MVGNFPRGILTSAVQQRNTSDFHPVIFHSHPVDIIISYEGVNIPKLSKYANGLSSSFKEHCQHMKVNL